MSDTPEETVQTEEELEQPSPEETTEAKTEVEETAEVQEEVLDLSDEEFEKQLAAAEEAPVEETDDSNSDEDIAAADAPEDLSENDKPEETAETTETAEASAAEETKPEEAPKPETADASKESTAATDKPDGSTDKAAPAAPVKPLDMDDAAAAAGFRELFKPFKANGKEVQVRNMDEAKRLMQMGAGYTATMMKLKPQMALVKTLTNNGISADDINYFVELKSGNPDAIKKLVRDAKIDPLDIETDETGQAADAKYRPKDYSASETQVNFELAIEAVKSYPGGQELLESVRDEWDGQSRDTVYNDPSILDVLAEQKQNGLYAQIVTQIDHERMLGNLKDNVPFIQAYQAVGQAMSEQGLLKLAEPSAPEPVTTTPSTTAQPTPEPEVLERKAVAPKAKTTNDAKAKAVAPVQSTVGTKAAVTNPLNMSDEDFEKLEGFEHLV